MEDDFYASVKLISGEEIFSKVSVCDENDRTMLILAYPVILEEIKLKKQGTVGYKVEPWIKTASDDMFMMNFDKVITISESNDLEIISIYNQYIRDSAEERTCSSKSSMTKQMGYIASVREAKDLLEKLYKL